MRKDRVTNDKIKIAAQIDKSLTVVVSDAQFIRSYHQLSSSTVAPDLCVEIGHENDNVAPLNSHHNRIQAAVKLFFVLLLGRLGRNIALHDDNRLQLLKRAVMIWCDTKFRHKTLLCCSERGSIHMSAISPPPVSSTT
jgi:hypothetical protein